MRILHLNTHASGGSYEYAALLCTALEEQGIEGRLLTKNSRTPAGLRAFFDRVIRRSYVSLSTEPWHGTRRLLPSPAAEELAGVDVVHLHMVADWFDVPFWLETLPNRISAVISIHDMWHITGGCFLYRGCDRYRDMCTPCPILRAPFNRVLARDEHGRKLQAYQRRRVKFVANSQWLANLAEQSPVVRACGGLRVITPGINTNIFTIQNKTECRANLGIAPDAFVIAAGAPSLTDTNKNIRWLLEQLASLPESKNVIVLLAGEGNVPIPAHLNVRVMGGIADRKTRAIFFGAADVFVSASLMETYGLTLVEAMACGTPVVAFRVGGIPEAAPDGQGAILCERQDAAALIEAITKLRESPQHRLKLGRLAYETAQSRSAAGSFAGKFAQLYRECVVVEQTTYANRTATAT
jgi:glycosyltransferase involved in cell wall biosynthesis